MKKLLCIALLLSAGTLSAVHAEQMPGTVLDAAPVATVAVVNRDLVSNETLLPLGSAAMDSISTYSAIQSGLGAEANGLINTSAAGLLGLFAFKTGIVYYANTLQPEQRKSMLKHASGVWGGISVNNILIMLGASGPQAIVLGIAAGFGFYHWESKILDKTPAPLAATN